MVLSVGWLRFFQVVFLLAAFEFLFILSHFKYPKTNGPLTLVQWIAILWAAYAGLVCIFGKQWLESSRAAQRVTPTRRWSLGNMLWIAGALQVSLSGLVLHLLGGPAWLIDTLFAIGIILLLMWRPGGRPVSA